MTLNIDTLWTKTLDSMKAAAKMSRLSYSIHRDFIYLPYEQRLNFGMNYNVLAEVTDGDWNAYKRRLLELHNIEYREYAYAQYVEQVSRFLPYPFVTVDTCDLVKSLTAAKVDFKAGTPNAYALRVELGKRKSENELMVTLPVDLAGYAIEISYEYLLDLLYVFKRCKVKTLKLRIEPLANGVSSDKRSVLNLVDGKDVFCLYSSTALQLPPVVEPAPDFTLYDTPAMPGGDAAPFPAAHGQSRALMVIPTPCTTITVYQAGFTPLTIPAHLGTLAPKFYKSCAKFLASKGIVL